ncbi:MAG: hypothetical protein ACJZ88_07380, partial [Paracoccus marcusii]
CADEPLAALLVYKARDVYEEALGLAIDGRLKEQFAQFARTLDVTATIADRTLEAVGLAAAA